MEQAQSQTTNQEYKLRPERKREKCKAQGLRCYGFLTDSGEFDCALFGYGPCSYIPGSRYIENDPGRFVNARREADWLSVSTFNNARLGRTEENISHTLCCFLDLDGPYTSELPDGEKVEIQLTDDIIRQRCHLLGLPMPLIIETSPGRFHVKFYFKRPVPISEKDYLKLVQRALFEAFKDIGADPVVTTDLTRFLRNENQENSVNKKYPDKPKVIIREEGKLCSLGQLYHTLKKHGFIKAVERQKWRSKFNPHYTPIEESRNRLIIFLKGNPEYKATYQEMADSLSIPLRTVKYLCSQLKREGKLSTKTVGKGRDRMTLFTMHFFKVHIKESLTTAPCNTGIKKRFLAVVGRISRVGFPAGRRNNGVFMLSVGLKACGFTEPEIVVMLEPGFYLSQYAGVHRFTTREFIKTVNSPFKRKYRYCVGFDNPKWDWDGLLRMVTKLECEVLRKLDSRGECEGLG